MTSRCIEEVLFVHSDQGEIDRGWDPRDARNAVVKMGLRTEEIHIRELADLDKIQNRERGALVWPTCYTIGADAAGPVLSKSLKDASIPIVGVTYDSVRLSNKLLFKEALSSTTPHSSPAWRVLDVDLESVDPVIGMPSVIKTEFSCNSEGVRVARNIAEANKHLREFKARIRQKVYIERWERHREFTVAFLPSSSGASAMAAALEITLADTRQILDSEAKNDNSLVLFSSPDPHLADLLESTTIDIAQRLGIDGHFRLDFLQNESGKLFVIEVNLLPHMTESAAMRSYFPLAFELSRGLPYSFLIKRIVEHAADRCGLGLRRAEDGERP